MADVVALSHSGLNVPVRRWLQETRALPQLHERIDTLLDLDSYGKSKLPGEREVWAWFVAELDPTVSALRDSRPATEFEIDHRQLERELARTNIQPNSRRWNEIIKRVEECVSGINELVEVQAVAAPWLGLQRPPALETVPADAVAALGDLAAAVFEPLVTNGELWWLSRSPDVAEQLELMAAELGESELSWLSTVADGWFRAANDNGLQLRMPKIEQMTARRNAVERDINELRTSGIDADEVELLLMDHDISGAVGAVGLLREQRQVNRRSDALASKLTQFRRAHGMIFVIPPDSLAPHQAIGTLDHPPCSRRYLGHPLMAAGIMTRGATTRDEPAHSAPSQHSIGHVRTSAATTRSAARERPNSSTP